MRTITFDIETNAGDFRNLAGFDRVHCMSYCVDGKKDHVKRVIGTGETLKVWRKLVDFAKKAKVTIVGHNIVSFDLPVLYEIFLGHLGVEDKQFLSDFREMFLLPQENSNVTIMDTKLMCQLAFPDLYAMSEKDPAFKRLQPKYWGSHSLKNWGKRLGVQKDSFGETTDWETYTESMGTYCDKDVIVTQELVDFLMRDRRTDWLKTEDGRKVNLRETQFAQLIRQQELCGVNFDEESARKLQEKIHEEVSKIEQELADVFPAEVVETKSPKFWKVTHKESGDSFKAETKSACEAIRKKRGWKPKEVTFEKGPMKTKTLPFNPGSRQQIVERLKERYGWEPDEFTEPSVSYPDGQPKVDGEVLESLEYPEAKLLARYLDLQKIYGYLVGTDNSWCANAINGRIHGKVNTLGANTSRCTHTAPNMAQVPSSRKPYGKECRELFCASEGMDFVGWDASGLELRCLAGYLAQFDRGRYAKIVTEGDVHTTNQEAAGLPTRDLAKTFIYGTMYGAGHAKIGKIIGKDAYAGKLLKETFINNTPGYERLIETISNALDKRGYLLGLDRRHLFARSAHSALNLILQSAGAIIMKEALIQYYFRLKSEGILLGKHYNLLLNVHDEVQCECLPDYTERLMVLAPEAIELAGLQLRLRCPLTGEAQTGTSWADTH